MCTFRFISHMFAIKRFANAVRLTLFLTPFFLILYLQIVKKKKKMKNRQGIQTNTNVKSYPPRSRVVILKAINFSSHGSAHSAVIRHVFLTAKTCPIDCKPTVNHEWQITPKGRVITRPSIPSSTEGDYGVTLSTDRGKRHSGATLRMYAKSCPSV